MLTEQRILDTARVLFEQHGLDDWTFAIEDEHPTLEQAVGFTHFDIKRIEVYREVWPTCDQNVVEVIRHEAAHAIVGNGRHDSAWWSTLMSIGGTGAWIEDDGTPAAWSWTQEAAMRNDPQEQQ